MGVPNESDPPLAQPRDKKAIRSDTIGQCEEIAERVMSLEAARDVDLYLLDRLGTFVPELIVN